MPGDHGLWTRDGEGPSCLPPLATLCNSWTTSQDRSHARGLWVRSCHLVRWFVLSTTDLCQEDQGPNRNPWPALPRHTRVGCGSSQRLAFLRSPGCWAASQPSSPMAAQSPAPACGHEASFQGPAWPLCPPAPRQWAALPTAPHFPGACVGRWGEVLQLEKHQEALHSPLGLLYIFSFYS